MLRPLFAALALVSALAAPGIGSTTANAAGLAGTMQTAERPVLRADITIRDDIATIGDFFANAGHMALTPLFRAPDLGRTGTVPAAQVMQRAVASGLANPDINGLDEVIVRRASVELTPETFTGMIRDALAERIGITDLEDLELAFAGQLPTESADPKSPVPLYLEHLAYSSRSGRFDARFTVRQGTRDKIVSIAGIATETVNVTVLSRRLLTGDTVTARDLGQVRIPRNRLATGVVTDATQIVGLVTRRPQLAGRPLRKHDFEPPLMVKRRETVIITYAIPGMQLTVQGEAMQDGADGDTINVVNSQSHRIVEATVTGPGRVSVITAAARVASLGEFRK